MKVLQRKGVAVVILIAAILLSSAYGLSKKPAVDSQTGPKLDQSLSTAAYTQYIVDDAGLVDPKTEQALSIYNANWDQWAGSILAVATVPKVEGSMEETAYFAGMALELGENDAVLLLCSDGPDAYLYTSGNFYDAMAGQESAYLSACLYEDAMAGRWDDGVLALFDQINGLFAQAAAGGSGAGTASALVAAVTLLVILVVIFSALDSVRYSTWRRRYGAMPYPPVIFRPILWWNTPMRMGRRWHSPPPPTHHPPKGGGFGGPRSGGGGFCAASCPRCSRPTRWQRSARRTTRRIARRPATPPSSRRASPLTL